MLLDKEITVLTRAWALSDSPASRASTLAHRSRRVDLHRLAYALGRDGWQLQCEKRAHDRVKHPLGGSGQFF